MCEKCVYYCPTRFDAGECHANPPIINPLHIKKHPEPAMFKLDAWAFPVVGNDNLPCRFYRESQ